jgi:hypothetical protein
MGLEELGIRHRARIAECDCEEGMWHPFFEDSGFQISDWFELWAAKRIAQGTR